MLVGQALACMQRSGAPEMQRSGVPEHFSVAMTVIYELIRGTLGLFRLTEYFLTAAVLSSPGHATTHLLAPAHL